MPAHILGIVAEYDPFHLGHAYHMNEARKLVQPDAVYVALSPCFTQRGSLSLLSPHDRALCALSSGADAVFALPVLWTVRDAERYALGAVSLLAGLGATHLAFGAETPDLALLKKAADLLEDPPAAFTGALKQLLSLGKGYPAALAEAGKNLFSEAEGLLSSPNNTLAICYLRAIHRLRLPLIPVVIPRRGAYRASSVQASAPSASAIREALCRGDYSALKAVPTQSAACLRAAFLAGNVPDPEIYSALLLSALRAMPQEGFRSLPDAAEGLGDALSRLRNSALSFREIVESLTSRRYASSRISRLCALALLGESDAHLRSLALPRETMLLGLRRDLKLTASWKDLPVRVIPSAVDWAKSAAPPELLSWKIRSLCCRRAATGPFSEKTVVL